VPFNFSTQPASLQQFQLNSGDDFSCNHFSESDRRSALFSAAAVSMQRPQQLGCISFGNIYNICHISIIDTALLAAAAFALELQRLLRCTMCHALASP
jgi:hypothetical protein